VSRVSVLVIALLLSGAADAQPSVWKQAARRELRPQTQALAKIDRLLAEEFHLFLELPTSFRRGLLLARARKMLENIGAARSQDPAIRFRLGQVYYKLYNFERDEKLLQMSAQHLAFVGRSNGPRSMRSEAFSDLAICYARLGRHREEVEAYTQALLIEPHSKDRAVLLANRAEGLMVQGDITGAVRGYRASLKETPSERMPFGPVTTMWGLGVALDRSGDLEGALEQIRTARSHDPGDELIHSDSWFYVPAYDESWYSALGHWQAARAAENQEIRLEAYRSAIGFWRAYIERAPSSDHWVALANLRLKQCERELESVLRQPPRKKPNADASESDAH